MTPNTESSALCRYCAAPFTQTRDWQLFCSSRCRTRHSRDNRHCFYCGVSRGLVRDHVNPVSGRAGARHYDCETVKACGECNAWLSDRSFDSPEDRVQFIADSLQRKYRLDKPPVLWAPDELAEMGRSMQARIRKHYAQRRVHEDRRAYASAVAYGLREGVF